MEEGKEERGEREEMQLELSTTKLQLLHLCRAQRLRHGSKMWVVVKMVKMVKLVKMLLSKHTSTSTGTKD